MLECEEEDEERLIFFVKGYTHQNICWSSTPATLEARAGELRFGKLRTTMMIADDAKVNFRVPAVVCIYDVRLYQLSPI